MHPGGIVRCRNRDWVLLPGADDDVHLLRPLTGATEDVVAMHRQLSNLIGGELPEERLRPASFPLPAVDDLADAAGAHLLWQAARLTLRDGATPFRSLGRICIRPRTYQFVPLLMALRLDPVRLLIADDVGVGKTIEALLVARELLDRGEIRRLCVLCPPNLCEQWRQEMGQKFGLDAVVVRSGTIGQLERRTPVGTSVYRHHPVQVASIDFVKSDRNRHAFLQNCPELVIVDEAHGATASSEGSRQQRHGLVGEVAARAGQHLMLLTATPHSGVEAAFRSLLALLDACFAEWDTSSLTARQRTELARHFVQRTRADIEREWDDTGCFPARVSSDETWPLSGAYRDLFQRTYDFCYESVQSGGNLDQRRYWGALALLGCVMSSPAAATAALQARGGARAAVSDEPDEAAEPRWPLVEASDDRADDDQPTGLLESAGATLDAAGRARLQAIGDAAEELRHSAEDRKLTVCADLGGARHEVEALHRRWDRDVERERVNRSRFAQRAIKPDAVRQELEAADDVLGDPDAVRRFVLDAGQRLRLGITPDARPDVFRLPVGAASLATAPDPIRFALPLDAESPWRISFTSPTPDGATYLGRNHPFVSAPARFLMEEALEKGAGATAARCGVVRTRAVPRLRTVLLLRVRYLLQQPERPPLLSEEVVVQGIAVRRTDVGPDRLPDDEALQLLAGAKPEANVPLGEKRELVGSALARWPAWRAALDAPGSPLVERAVRLEQAHKRVRRAVRETVRHLAVVPQFPPDLLGVLVLQPLV